MANKWSSARFTVGQIASAASANAATLRQWLARGVLSLSEDDTDSAGSTYARLFTAPSAVALALACALAVRDKTDVARQAGALFAFTGDDERPACRLYPEGDTLLLIHSDGSSRIVNAKAPEDLSRIFAERPDWDVRVIDLTTKVAEIASALQLDPYSAA